VLGRQPAIEFPDKLDLGEHEIGEQVVFPFTIANRGAAELIVDQISSNCSCSGMEREDNGSYSRITSLQLKPGEEARVVMRVSVAGVPIGTNMINVVQFHTNDPQAPTGRIEAIVSRVSGGVTTTPEAVVFGSVPVGASVRQIVHVWDKSTPPREIERVETCNPHRIRVRLVSNDNKTPEVDSNINGRVIGTLEVIVNSEEPCHVNGTIEIHLAGEARNPDKVIVQGTIVAPFQITPSVITLPRESASGQIYSATCICRSTKGESLTLKVDVAPPGLTAQASDQVESKAKVIQITWDPEQLRISAGSQREVIRFLVQDGESEAILELPVILRK